MGGFHIALNFLSLPGKKFGDSGVDDLLSTSALMKGKSYNQGIRAHKLCLEVFLRLMWNVFVVWYESQDKKIPEEPVLSKIADCVRAVENGKDHARESVRKIEADLGELMSLFGSLIRRIEQGPSSSHFGMSNIRFHGHFPFTVSKGRENWELEVASIKHRSHVTSFLCYEQAELCSLLTCLSRVK